MVFVQLTCRDSVGYSGVHARSHTKYLSHGHSPKDLPQYTGLNKIDKRLAYLCRFCTNTHSKNQATTCGRFFWCRVGTNLLCTGCHKYRLMPVSLSVGGIPAEQGYREMAYAFRSERHYFNDCIYDQRESSQSQYRRQTAYRSQHHSHYGSPLFGLRSSLQVRSIGNILYYTCQKQRQIPWGILSENRQKVLIQIRLGHYVARL